MSQHDTDTTRTDPGTDSTPHADKMPMLGLGTWDNTDPAQCATSVETALELGYRHIDGARAYGNEAAVGEGIANADVPREEIFLATKVWINQLSREGVFASVEASLNDLGVDWVDLLYVHYPAGTYDPETTLGAFQTLYDQGRIDRIGVSNFEPAHLDTAREILDVPVFANQVEMHPLLQQAELREYGAAHDINLVAYSPLGRGTLFDVPELTEIAEKHDVSPAQVSLAWLCEKDVTAIPKATSEGHIRDNWASLELDLDDEDMATIDSIDRERRITNPDWAPSSW